MLTIKHPPYYQDACSVMCLVFCVHTRLLILFTYDIWPGIFSRRFCLQRPVKYRSKEARSIIL